MLPPLPGSSTWRKGTTHSRLAGALIGADVSVDLRTDSARFSYEAMRAKVKRRIGSLPPGPSLVLTDALPWFGKDPLIHERDLALSVLKLWTGTTSGSPGRSAFDRLWPRKLSFAQVQQLSEKLRPTSSGLPRLVSQEGRQRSGIFINPTASRREKAWPVDRFTKLTRFLQSQQPEPVRLLGAPHETDWLKSVQADLSVEIVQPVDITDALKVLSSAKLLVANTSSLQFLAACSETPVVTLMGRANPTIWGPVGPSDQFLQASFPSSWASSDIFQQEVEAYQRLDLATVQTAVLERLQRRSGMDVQ